MKEETTLKEHLAPSAAVVVIIMGEIVFTSRANKITLEKRDGLPLLVMFFTRFMQRNIGLS